MGHLVRHHMKSLVMGISLGKHLVKSLLVKRLVVKHLDNRPIV